MDFKQLARRIPASVCSYIETFLNPQLLIVLQLNGDHSWDHEAYFKHYYPRIYRDLVS